MTSRRCYDLPANEITPEPVYRRRRELMGAALAAPLLSLAGCVDGKSDAPAAAQNPAKATAASDKQTLTTYEDVTTYNNFYEFGTDKADPAKNAHTLKTSPWSITIAGHAEVTGEMSLDDILKDLTAEERIYRLRCVEGWSMVIPWLGVPLAAVLKKFKPTSKAKYVAFTSLADPEQMPGVRSAVLEWPYREGLRIDEAMNDLSLLATGLYGKPMPNQNGAPIRLITPWKYGFKSIKSLVRIEFTEQMPPTSWNMSQPSEYGFYSNVNPEVDHPRWSQKTERRIAGEGLQLFAKRIPTQMFNGYAEQVGSMYSGMDLRQWF